MWAGGRGEVFYGKIFKRLHFVFYLIYRRWFFALRCTSGDQDMVSDRYDGLFFLCIIFLLGGFYLTISISFLLYHITSYG